MTVPLWQRQRVLLLGALVVMIGLAWAYLAWMAAAHAGGAGHAAHHALMPQGAPAGLTYVGWLFVMWSVMAVAMMLPTALPLVAMYARSHGGRHPQRDATAPTLALVAGYLVAWGAFGAAAAVLQWSLESVGWLTPMMGELRSRAIGGLVLAGAGLFQLSPLKTACLNECRTPLGFLMTRWRDGTRGALVMGLDHGAHCLGCCWALMLVMFVVGVMNLAWMAVLTVLMLVEKVAPRGDLIARVTGIGLIGGGAALALL